MVTQFIGKADKTGMITAFVLIFIGLYLLVYKSQHIFENFFIVVFIVVLYIIYNRRQEEQKNHMQDLDIYITYLEQLVLSHNTPEMIVEFVYKIHKPLKSLRFIRQNKEARETLYLLRFLLIYDKEDFIDIIICLEYFFKIHYNVLIEKYDISTNFAVLKDLRSEMLNALYSSYFNIPNISKTFDVPNLENELDLGIKRIQALTYRHMKILYHKYSKELKHEQYAGPKSFDNQNNTLYHMH